MRSGTRRREGAPLARRFLLPARVRGRARTGPPRRRVDGGHAAPRASCGGRVVSARSTWIRVWARRPSARCAITARHRAAVARGASATASEPSQPPARVAVSRDRVLAPMTAGAAEHVNLYHPGAESHEHAREGPHCPEAVQRGTRTPSPSGSSGDMNEN